MMDVLTSLAAYFVTLLQPFYQLESLFPLAFAVVLGIFTLIFGELIYMHIIKKVKLSRKDAQSQSERWAYTIGMKIFSLIVGAFICVGLYLVPIFILALVLVIVSIVEVIVNAWEGILIVLGISAVVFGYLWMNKKYADKHIKVETVAEEKEREKKEKARKKEREKERASRYEFKIGEKVRVKKDMDTVHNYKDKYRGKIVTIERHRGLTQFCIKEDNNRWYWGNDQVSKIKPKRKKKVKK